MNQINLPFVLNDKMLISNFIGNNNKQILSFIDKLFINKNSSVVYIVGEKSSGKTHLLQGITFAALNQNLNAFYLDCKQDLTNYSMENIINVNWLCIDNIEFLPKNNEQILFDFYNNIAQTNIKLIISSNYLPKELNILADLKTRLSLAYIFNLENLNDEQKIIIIKEKMANKNIKIDEKIFHYLFKYFSRDIQKVLAKIKELDTKSLQQKNKISIAFTKKFI